MGQPERMNVWEWVMLASSEIDAAIGNTTQQTVEIMETDRAKRIITNLVERMQWEWEAKSKYDTGSNGGLNITKSYLKDMEIQLVRLEQSGEKEILVSGKLGETIIVNSEYLRELKVTFYSEELHRFILLTEEHPSLYAIKTLLATVEIIKWLHTDTTQLPSDKYLRDKAIEIYTDYLDGMLAASNRTKDPEGNSRHIEEYRKALLDLGVPKDKIR